jgi:hypothetical protein
VGRGGARRRGRLTAMHEHYAPEAERELAYEYAFADAIGRIMDLGHDEHEAFGLSTHVPVPALDLAGRPHEEISRAHAKLLRRCARRAVEHRGTSTERVPVRVIDLSASTTRLRALIASIAFLAQATTKEDATVSIPGSMRDGLIGEGLTDAYFVAEGWQSIVGIGAFYRRRAGTYGARLTHGTGLDHLFARRLSDGTLEYVAVETKVCRSAASLDGYLRGQFEDERLRGAGAETYAMTPLSAEWIADRLDRSFVRGELNPDAYAAVREATAAGRLRRVVVLIACPDYDRPGRPHIPNPDGLVVRTADGPKPLADEVVTLRVPKSLLTTLVGDISNARARSIAAIALKPRGLAARLWRKIDG